MPPVSVNKRKEVLWAVIVVVLLTLVGLVCDHLVAGRFGVFLGDFLPALAAGVLFWLMRMHQHIQMRLADERVEIMREAIDHIRNAMQIVVYSRPDEIQLAAINRLMRGIDSTLVHVAGQPRMAK